MKWIIYSMLSKTSNKQYIGITSRDINTRLTEHRCYAKNNSNHHFHRAIRLYGSIDFSLKILEESKDEEAYDLEKFYINKHNTFKDGYNMTIGGDRGPRLYGKMNGMFNKKHSKESKKKMSIRKKKLVGKLHPHYGTTTKLKNKSYEEIMGKEKAKILKINKSLKMKIIKPFKKYIIIDNNYNVYFNDIVLVKFCEVMNFSYNALSHNIDKGLILKPTRKHLGWEIMENI